MRRAVELAKRAGEETRPNPRVGAVLVQGGKLVGTGFHRRAGEPHAEVLALRKAGSRAKEADLYVTMEPCSTHGRTPPCTKAIIDSGVRRVIYGSRDVDPRNRAKADRILKRAGIQVVRGVWEKDCDQINEDYRHWTTRREPWVILKLAMTLEGYLTIPEKRWITGSKARNEVQKLRAGCDAILVGAETVRQDNPRLTIRKNFRPSAESPEVEQRQPWRVVVTRSGKLPKTAKLFRDRYRGRTLVYQNKKWSQILRDLRQRGVCRLLVEGGLKTAHAMLQAGKIHELILHLSPQSVGGSGPRWMHAHYETWGQATCRSLGDDIELRLLHPSQGSSA